MTSYDYIVVGAGSAGAVVAGRLSENPDLRVLLIEAGGSHRHPNVQIPAAFPKQFKTKLDWEYYTEPEPHLDGRSLLYQRGKMLGGCSSMNAMIYIRGNRHDYDAWAKDGATGWSYDEVLPLFKRTENNSRGANHYHGVDGPQHIQDQRNPSELTHTMIEAMVETGMPRNPDFNGEEQEGVGFNQVCQNRGQRWTTADAFLTPARSRSNLTMQRNTQVLRVRLAGDRAVGVETNNGFFHAEREVILSGGAINTPQLLMLSGVGPADHLAEHGITALVDNPHVGAHLMEHPFYMVNYETTASKGTLFGAGIAAAPGGLLRPPARSADLEHRRAQRILPHREPRAAGHADHRRSRVLLRQRVRDPRPAGVHVRDVADRVRQRGLGSAAQRQSDRQGRGQPEHLRRAVGHGFDGRRRSSGPARSWRPRRCAASSARRSTREASPGPGARSSARCGQKPCTRTTRAAPRASVPRAKVWSTRNCGSTACAGCGSPTPRCSRG